MDWVDYGIPIPSRSLLRTGVELGFRHSIERLVSVIDAVRAPGKIE
jgi:hypothetical protein